MKFNLPKIFKRAIPNVTAHEIIGVQPMTGPVGQKNFTMGYRYGNVNLDPGWENGMRNIWLDFLYNDVNWYHERKHLTEQELEVLNQRMQEKYIGGYTIDVKYNVERCQLEHFILFDSPEEESMFLLRHSNV